MHSSNDFALLYIHKFDHSKNKVYLCDCHITLNFKKMFHILVTPASCIERCILSNLSRIVLIPCSRLLITHPERLLYILHFNATRVSCPWFYILFACSELRFNYPLETLFSCRNFTCLAIKIMAHRVAATIYRFILLSPSFLVLSSI